MEEQFDNQSIDDWVDKEVRIHTIDECYQIVQEMMTFIDDESFDIENFWEVNTFIYISKMQQLIESDDLTGTLMKCHLTNNPMPFIKSTFPWRYASIFQNYANWFVSVIEADDINYERLVGLRNSQIYNSIISSFQDIFPQHFINQFIEISNKQNVISNLIYHAIENDNVRYIDMLRSISNIYDYKFINNHIDRNNELLSKDKILNFLNDMCYGYENNDDEENDDEENYDEEDCDDEPLKFIDEHTIIDKFFEIFVKDCHTKILIFSEDIFECYKYLFEYFEFMTLSQMVETWNLIEKYNVDIHDYFLQALCIVNSRIAIEYFLTKISSETIEEWLHYSCETTYFSKSFTELIISKYPNSREKIYLIAVSNDDFLVHFPDTDLKECIAIIERSHQKIEF